jgi:hypothetical protein
MNSFHPSPFNKTIEVSAAAMTPDAFRTFSRSSRLYPKRLAAATLRGEKSKSATRTLFCRNPTSRLSRFLKVRTNSRATSSTRESATCETISPLRSRKRSRPRSQPATVSLHHRPGIGTGRLDRGGHTKEHAGQQRHSKRERQNPKIRVSEKKDRILRATNVPCPALGPARCQWLHLPAPAAGSPPATAGSAAGTRPQALAAKPSRAAAHLLWPASGLRGLRTQSAAPVQRWKAVLHSNVNASMPLVASSPMHSLRSRSSYSALT